MTLWSVRYYCDQDGRVPVADFFAVPSDIGITRAERVKFFTRLELVAESGLDLIQRQSDILESLKGETNLLSLRLKKMTNNPRVLACALEGHRCIVLLHAFKELSRTAYRRELPTGRTRRDAVTSDPSRWVCDFELPVTIPEER